MNVRLSHSSMNRFMECPTSWKNHYQEGYRPTELSSALIFGSAIGKTIEFVLKAYKDGVECSKKQIEDIWAYNWTNQMINDVLVNTKDYPHVAYSKYDTDLDLLTKEEINEITDCAAWYSLKAKGLLILDKFVKDFLPLVEHIYSVEEQIELTNDEGDSSIGFSDTVIKLKGWDKPIILDFKTAAREYPLDAVSKSVQLSQYMHVQGEQYNTRLAGYCVFLKNIEKDKVKTCKKCGHIAEGSHKLCNNQVLHARCNGEWDVKLRCSVTMQLLVNELPLATEEFIVGNIEDIAKSIKSGIFYKNVNNCFETKWGRPCEFLNLCWKNSTEGLVRVEPKGVTSVSTIRND